MAKRDQHVVLEALPDSLVAGLEVRDAFRKRLADSTVGLEFLVSDLARWPVGSTVRVAFLDGDTALHGEVADATKQLSANMNLKLDFGKTAAGKYRRWKTTDTTRKAEIRVSFDMEGFWSLVGTDSIDTSIAPTGPIGGGPGQRSLNLGGFTVGKPPNWQGVVRHEFMHAMAFRHEHQNMRGPCEDDFRWDDDPGYVPTRDADGRFVPDAAGKRPGIYTYLAGPPNSWSKAKVDHNLRTANDPNAVAGPFDAASVMLYRFAAFFYKTNPSPCAPSGNGLNLSDGDKRGLKLLYPKVAGDAGVADQAVKAMEILGGGQTGPFEAAVAPAATGSDHLDQTLALLRAHATGKL